MSLPHCWKVLAKSWTTLWKLVIKKKCKQSVETDREESQCSLICLFVSLKLFPLSDKLWKVVALVSWKKKTAERVVLGKHRSSYTLWSELIMAQRLETFALMLRYLFIVSKLNLAKFFDIFEGTISTCSLKCLKIEGNIKGIDTA